MLQVLVSTRGHEMFRVIVVILGVIHVRGAKTFVFVVRQICF